MQSIALYIFIGICDAVCSRKHQINKRNMIRNINFEKINILRQSSSYIFFKDISCWSYYFDCSVSFTRQ